MPRSLGQAVRSAPRATFREVEVDISEFYDEEPGSTVFRFRDLSTAQLFAVPADADQIEKRYPEWPETLPRTVALLAMAHVAPLPEPGEPPVGELYAELADQADSKLFGFLSGRFYHEFPHLANLEQALKNEREKKGLTKR